MFGRFIVRPCIGKCPVPQRAGEIATGRDRARLSPRTPPERSMQTWWGNLLAFTANLSSCDLRKLVQVNTANRFPVTAKFNRPIVQSSNCSGGNARIASEQNLGSFEEDRFRGFALQDACELSATTPSAYTLFIEQFGTALQKNRRSA